MGILRKCDLDKVERQKCIDILRTQADEIDFDLSELLAGDMLDDLLLVIGPIFHNKGIATAKKLITERMGDIEVDLDLLNQT